MHIAAAQRGEVVHLLLQRGILFLQALVLAFEAGLLAQKGLAFQPGHTAAACYVLVGTRTAADQVTLPDGTRVNVGTCLAEAREGTTVRVGVRPEHVGVVKRSEQEVFATLESVMVVGSIG